MDGGLDATNPSDAGSDSPDSAGDAVAEHDVVAQPEAGVRCHPGLLEAGALPPKTLAFAPASSVSQVGVTGIIQDFIVTDVTGDGNPDLVFSTEPSSAPPFYGNIHFMKGYGNGGFAYATTAWTGDSIGPIAAGDFDGDGHVDLAVAGRPNSKQVNILRGDGTGGFQSWQVYPVDSYVIQIVVADLDEDGASDLIFAASSEIIVRLNRGGSFPTQTLIPSGPDSWDPWFLAAGHFNPGGHIGLAFSWLGDGMVGEKGAVGVLFGGGDGGLTVGPVVTANDYGGFLAVADFNGDRLDDLAVLESTNAGTPSLVVLESQSGPTPALRVTFTAQLLFSAGSSPYIDATDLDGDGCTDLAIAGDATLAVFRGKGDATFFAPSTFPTPAMGVHRMEPLRVDGGGPVDLVIDSPFYPPELISTIVNLSH
jgi:hypothetical protein